MTDPQDTDDRAALYTSTILSAIARLRFEVRLIALGLALLVIAFIAHAVLFVIR